MGLSDDALLDWQQQVDEVQALEAIYGDDFRTLEASGILESDADAAGSSSGGGATGGQHPPNAASLAEVAAPTSASWVLDCSLMVRMEPPAGSLRMQLPQEVEADDTDVGSAAAGSSSCEAGAGDPGSGSGSGRPQHGGYRVQFLPPICMQLRLAAGYPSQHPPDVSLSALWLSSAAAATLEGQLQQLWHEQGAGGAVCYTWADWLQSSALHHLGAAEVFVLGAGPPSGGGVVTEAEHGGSGEGAGGSRGGGPSRSSSGMPGGEEADMQQAEDTLMKLLRYNAVQEHAAFLQAQHTCGICLEEQPGRCFVRLDCRHAWCAGCLEAQARLHVAEGSLEALRCPDPKCKAPLGPGMLQRVLSAEDYARWEQLTLQRTLDTMPDAAYCPRCSTVSIEDADSCAQCPRCFFVFCSLCMEGWHPATTCVSAETKLAMLRRKMEGGGRAALEDLRRQEQDLLSVAQIEKTAKKCPRCGMATQKAEGCNKMACGGCGAYWCWRCGKEIDGYRHFRTGECILFDEAEILRWEAQWEEMQAAARVMAAGMRNEFVGETAARQGARPRGCFCPQCGQVNHKLGNNNHMQCWSCTSHFCYCCRSVLRGKGAGGSHYGPKGCKQHSPD